jgi:hypothetical protein
MDFCGHFVAGCDPKHKSLLFPKAEVSLPSDRAKQRGLAICNVPSAWKVVGSSDGACCRRDFFPQKIGAGAPQRIAAFAAEWTVP